MTAPTTKLTRRKFLARSATLATLMSPVAVATDAFGIEPHWLRFERVEVPIRGLHSAFDGYRIALLSDTHYPCHIDAAFVHRAIAMGNAFRPDVWIFAGDFTDRKCVGESVPRSPFSPIVPSLSGVFDDLAAPDGVFGVRGNHDNWLDGPGVAAEVARSTPIRLIENSHRLIERAGNAKLAIAGVADLWTDFVDPIAALGSVDESIPRILISHNPDLAEEMNRIVRVDLQLSGHTHGGEVRVPFGPAPYVPSKYDNKFRSGLVEGKSHRVYVTRGICRPRCVRFCCRPEVTGIVLRCA